jgi:hypothetical protein
MLKPCQILKNKVCDGCNKKKAVVGEFVDDTLGMGRYFCPTCLDNASRLISKKADMIYWDKREMKLKGIYQEDIKRLEELYPGVDVFRVIEKDIPEWIIKKQLVGKTVKSDYRKTIMNWLKKEQLRAVGL